MKIKKKLKTIARAVLEKLQKKKKKLKNAENKWVLLVGKCELKPCCGMLSDW